MTSIPIENIVEELGLEIIYCSESQCIDVNTSDINRPGLQFAGFFDYFASERIQVLGKVEMTYLENMDPYVRDQQLNRFFQYEFPCLIVSTATGCSGKSVQGYGYPRLYIKLD